MLSSGLFSDVVFIFSLSLLQFMRELCAVWKWSVEERRGLFSRYHTPSLGDTGKKRESVQTRQHTLIIQVFARRSRDFPSIFVAHTFVHFILSRKIKVLFQRLFPPLVSSVPVRQVWGDPVTKLRPGPADIGGPPHVPHSGGGT